jgi:hypothetical protein
MAPVSIVSEFSRAFDPRADARNVAMVRRRHAWWNALRAEHGLPLALVDAADLRGGTADLADTRVAWIDLPMLPRGAYRALWRALGDRAPNAQVRDDPDDVAAVLGLDRIAPRLVTAGLPTPRTALLPLAPDTVATIAGPDDVRRHLLEAIYAALDAAALDPHDGLYVRGFYSSAKSPNPELWFARSQDDIVETVTALVGHLRGALEVGGLALRAFHALERVRLPAADRRAGSVTVPFEFRVTVLAGRAIGVSYHGPYEVLEDHQRAALDDALDARASAFDAIDALVPRLLTAGFPANYVADVAFDADRSPLVLELNPLYAAGYNVPAAHAWVVASLAHALVAEAGHDAAPDATIAGHAEALLGASVDGCPAFRRR